VQEHASGASPEKLTCLTKTNFMLMYQFLHLVELPFDAGIKNFQSISTKESGLFHPTLVYFLGTFLSLAHRPILYIYYLHVVIWEISTLLLTLFLLI
jgi:hypothetical protein